MERLISEMGDVSQSIDIARIFMNGMHEDIKKMNYQGAIKNYAKLNELVQMLNKKMVELSKTVVELEKIVNGSQK